jgi:ketosteroid isomerase-like protein
MSDAAMQIVFDHLYARRRGDLDALTAGLDPGVVHQGVVPSLVCTGRDAVVERMQSSLEQVETGIDRLELIAAGESVIVGVAGPRFDEIPFLNGEIFMLFTLRDGRIVRIDDYRSRDDAIRAAEVGGR